MSPEQMTLYWGKGCPSCTTLEAYFAANTPERLATINRKEIYHNKAHYEELREVGKAYGIPEEFIGVPFLAMGEKHLMGNASIIAYLEDVLPE
ncbi:hypothetical protein NB640_11860 [Oxalobacter vibrioformis]|uniref:Glutaredoxin n=1 Tax=Oxalobacter vibrioformis TaxID=933080 RepID=A0A9E9P3E0_9BURK|nr:hypothetical protein [Oxalobacter vibrioformis]WAW09898.1 hypothetical protein NB640_11860 [Oxalobacter vibrioformis]